MTDKELKTLKENLWHAADILREGAHLPANKYGQPILGLIFLRYADILFKQHKAEIEAEFNQLNGDRKKRNIKRIAIKKCGFYLPECAYYDKINDAPDDKYKATLVKAAMEAIEQENPNMNGVLPKEVYDQLVPNEEPELLSNIIRIFKDIPENCTVDIFGEIYEYFLGNFALAEGKDGGAFYTPATVVRYMVQVLDPKPGGEKKFLDPACGSGGMFVQAARYMHQHNATKENQMQFECLGVEKDPATVKLAKMNLLLNNVCGEIKEANSFYSDPFNAFGKFDYVMANPPFNVDEVSLEKVVEDRRFNTYGIPRNKSKSSKKKSDKKETVPNANYLWIGYFATALNEKGKAALVMANSASDASGSEYEIRKKLVNDGIISQMVTLPSNMFSSVTLPATLWFFDKDKPEDKKDEILFIDARNVFTQVDRAHRKFSNEQIKNLGIITRLYNKDTEAYQALLNEYEDSCKEAAATLAEQYAVLVGKTFTFDIESTDENGESSVHQKNEAVQLDFNEKSIKALSYRGQDSLDESKAAAAAILMELTAADKWLNIEHKVTKSEYKEKVSFNNALAKAQEAAKILQYFINNLLWLIERFPSGKYRDVIGLCKAAKLKEEDGIIDQDYSLNAGRYVGVVIEDDGMTESEFKKTMLDLNAELDALNKKAKELEDRIAENIKVLFGE